MTSGGLVSITNLIANRQKERYWPAKEALRDESLIDVLLDFLRNPAKYESENLPHDRSEAMKLLSVAGANLGREDVRAYFCSLLADDSARFSALDALSQFTNNHDVLDQLLDFAGSRQNGLRYAAVDVLHHLADPRVETFVLSRAEEIKNKHFLCHFLRTLARCGTEISVAPLLSLLKVNRSSDVRREVTSILETIAKRVILSPVNLKIVQKFLDNSDGRKEFKKPIRVGLEQMREVIEQRFNAESTLIQSEVGSYRFWVKFGVYRYGVQFLTYGVTVLEKSKIFPGSIPEYPSFHFQVDSRYFGVPEMYESLTLEQILADYDQRSFVRMLNMRDTVEEFRKMSFADFTMNKERLFEALAINTRDWFELPRFLNLIQLKDGHPDFSKFLSESSRYPLNPGERGGDLYKNYVSRNTNPPT